MIASIDPATGETFATFTPLTDAQLEERLARAESAFSSWRREPLARRAALLRSAADHFVAHRDEMAALAVREMGKLMKAARAEVEKCATCLRWYADNAEALLAPEVVKTEARMAQVRLDPLGPVLAVMPWNFPWWQVVRFAAPALLAGNVGLLKHASSVPQVSLRLERAFREAGFPKGTFQSLLVEARRVEGIVADPRVCAATLTGGEAAGASLAQAAGRHLKKTVLELGGSDPFIVLPSADIEKAAEVAVAARTQNNGQSCIAAKRFIVHEAVAERFESAMASRAAALRLGHPMDERSELGPLASAQIRDEVEEQLAATLARGARLLAGGQRPEGRGFFFPATVIGSVPEDSPAAREETFGPVAALLRARDFDDAIRLANGTRFGLGASVWTRDPTEERRAVAEIEAGCVFVNAMVKSDPRLPFGGVKASGYGRELSWHGLREFVNAKAVWVD